MKKTLIPGAVLLSALTLSACAQADRPSIPTKPGESFLEAKSAVQGCSGVAAQGGSNAVGINYVGNVLVGGLIGVAGAAMNEDAIRARGEANAVDRCLKKQGYTRRDLSDAEVAALNRSTAGQRSALLDHLVGGGTLADFRAAQ